MKIKSLINRHYILFGLSIVMSRGLEMIVLFVAAKILSKPVYGELEYYKKVLELGGVFLSFGFPAMILTYTRSKESKTYMLLFSSIFITILSVLLLPVLYLLGWTKLWLSFLFYALFFRGGVYPLYVLVKKGSDLASVFRATVSFVFYAGILWYILYSKHPSMAFVKVAAWLMLPGVFLLFHEWWHYRLPQRFVKRYFKHFTKLIYGSLTLVLNNFSNLMFLYTDIFIIKLFSSQPNIEIAEYSFSLNIANILMLIPLTLVQVDIEKIKKATTYFAILRKKIVLLTLTDLLVLIPFYYLLISRFYDKYANTFILFLIILSAKFFQSQSVLFGTTLLIKRKYNINLLINLFMILINVIASYVLYKFYGLYGVAVASSISLIIRFELLKYFYKRFTKQTLT